MKITKKETLTEAPKYLNEKCFNIREAHIEYGSIKIPTFPQIFANSNQSGQDQTKMLSSIINNFLYGYIKKYKNVDIKQEANNHDALYHINFLEFKSTLAKNGFVKEWIGNKASNKTPIHVLIAYTCNDTTITGLFIGVIDLTKGRKDREIYSGWKHGKSENSSYSKLQIDIRDDDKMHVLIGKRKKLTAINKYQHYEVEMF